MATILIVDDLAANREFLVTLLRYKGHRLREASDGRQALAAARAEHPDLVITDVLMPVMDGYELVRQLRLDPATRAIPVVFYTAHYGEREARSLALTSGVSYVLTKPGEPEDVIRIVEGALAGESETGAQPRDAAITDSFDQEHMRLLTDKLSEKAEDLAATNARLRALINIGLELGSERDANRLLDSFCLAARDLFGATYVTLGIVNRTDGTLRNLVTCGAPAGEWIRAGDAVPGILETVVGERRTLRGHNVAGDAARLRLPAGHPVIQAYLAAPLASPSHVYGWVCLAGNEGRTFGEDDVSLLTALAGQVGRIYENGYFYSVAQKRAEALEREIVERKQADADLRHERDRAERYLNTPDVILLALDMRGRITLVNRFACSLLGRTSDELLGQDFIDTCVPAGIRDATRTKLSQVHAGDDAVVENPIVTASGEERLVEWRTTFLRDDAGSIIGTFSSGLDITGRRLAESAVREERDRAQQYLDTADVILLALDLQGRITSVNRYAADLLGWTSAELIGRDWIGTCLPLRIQGALRQSFQNLVEGDLSTTENPVLTRAGEERLIEWRNTLLRDEAGRVVGTFSSGADITERKRAEEEIRRRASLSALSAAIGLALTGSDSVAGALQRCAEAIVTHLGAAFARVWTLNDRDGVLELQASAGIYTHLNGPHGRVPVGEFKIGRIARDRKPHLTNEVIGDPEVGDQDWARREGMVSFAGHPLIVHERVAGVMALFARHPLSDAVLSVLASVADHIALGIERYRTAEGLKAAEERMRFALQSAQIGIWDMDYTTGVLRWSETLEGHYGVRPGTFAGTFEAFMECVHPEDRDALIATVGGAMKTGADFRTENRAQWADGTVRWLSGAGRIHLGAKGEPVRGVGISLDVTERRTLEHQYQQAQKMEAVGRLAGGVAHDFNNLLSVILGYCEVLLADLRSDQRLHADVMEIQKAGESAAALTRQLLAFSRKQIIEPTLLDLGVVVAELRAMLGRLIGEDIKVVVGRRREPVLVVVDRGQLEQIVMNLVVNARDAMPKGGTLTIETANVELDEHYARTHLGVKAGLYAVLAVSDTGTGMTPEVQARLFEPFFTTKEQGRGTGLGLATVHGVVTRAGGTVGVYSELGKGTSFKVYFPRAVATGAEAAATPAAARPRTGAETVLVVEDADALRELARRLLQRQGYTALVAASAEEALRVFEQNPAIDVLLTDVVMPGASGPELTRELIDKRPGLKVVFMSGYTDEAIVNHGVLNPGVAFLHKPFTSEALGRKIREVLDR